jgi:hypothetical protein
MPELDALVLPALYALTAALVVAVAVTQGGAIPYYVRTYWLAGILLLGIPFVALLIGNHQLLVLLHVIGALAFVGAHSTSALVAFALPAQADPGKAEALLMLSGNAIDWLHASLLFLMATGIAAAFAGSWWGEPWLWLSLDLLLAITAYMYRAAPRAYSSARRALEDEGGPRWDDATRKLVNRGGAMRLMVTGTAALLAITALMIIKPG